MFQKNITEEEHHDNKTYKQTPTSGYVEIQQVTDDDKIKNSMQHDGKYA